MAGIQCCCQAEYSEAMREGYEVADLFYQLIIFITSINSSNQERIIEMHKGLCDYQIQWTSLQHRILIFGFLFISQTEYSMKRQSSQDIEFKPITLQTHTSSRQSRDLNKVHEYHKLMKMKRLLVDTQQKMKNRIELFKKASEKIIKKKQLEYKTFSKIENAKNHPFFLEKIKSREEIKTAQGRRLREQRKQNFETEQTRFTAQRIFQERQENAKHLKEQKQRFKVIIEQRKKIELQRKLQSASSIRKKRINAKLVREQLQNQRKEQFCKLINQKYQRQKEQFLQLERHLNELQIEQEQALLDWKKTMDNHYQLQ